MIGTQHGSIIFLACQLRCENNIQGISHGTMTHLIMFWFGNHGAQSPTPMSSSQHYHPKSKYSISDTMFISSAGNTYGALRGWVLSKCHLFQPPMDGVSHSWGPMGHKGIHGSQLMDGATSTANQGVSWRVTTEISASQQSHRTQPGKPSKWSLMLSIGIIGLFQRTTIIHHQQRWMWLSMTVDYRAWSATATGRRRSVQVQPSYSADTQDLCPTSSRPPFRASAPLTPHWAAASLFVRCHRCQVQITLVVQSKVW